jgi:tetratricopeptide (TPR) repeat protein
MQVTRATWSNGVALAIVAAVIALIARANRHEGMRVHDRPLSTMSGWPAATTTSRADLLRTIDRLRNRLLQQPADSSAAVLLADALLRQARVSGNAGLALGAEQALTRALHDEPLDYDARRTLAAVYLSEHRFRDAIREAEHARDQRPRDDWNYGVIGDGHLELGDYDEAFAAFQRMLDLRPTAGAYARAAYALELRGHLEAALEAMKLSTDATAPSDPESLAWHHAQLGDLYRQMGRLKEADFEYTWADYSFPGHPSAKIGMARVKEAEGDLPGALALFEELMSRTPTPDVAEKLGDVSAALGRPAEASREYALAEAGWRFDVPQPALLARFLAEHDLNVDEAVRLAEGAASDRHDIFTEDALAWSYFKAGRLSEAATAIDRARRTGTRDRSILFHAAAISQALGDPDGARQLAIRALDGSPRFDLRLAPAARKLLDWRGPQDGPRHQGSRNPARRGTAVAG